ncbi:MAG TPA: hypothetical protein VGQ83_29435 [Polyangia bacterium]
MRGPVVLQDDCSSGCNPRATYALFVLGTGFDVSLTRWLALRVMQLDVLLLDSWFPWLRLGGGLVVRLGSL